jgi:hypothetical protein
MALEPASRAPVQMEIPLVPCCDAERARRT